MLIKLNEVSAYCLNHSKYLERYKNIENMCSKLNMGLHRVPSDTVSYSHQKNVAYDSISLINMAISNNKYPFVIFEDDATLIDNIPETFDIPEEADLIYWGANNMSGPPDINNKIKINDHNKDYYRLYNSQSGHALLVPNKQSSLLLKCVYEESFYTNKFSDVILPNMSEQKVFLSPKDAPYFYQNDGRNHYITKFKWKNFNEIK